MEMGVFDLRGVNEARLGRRYRLSKSHPLRSTQINWRFYFLFENQGGGPETFSFGKVSCTPGDIKSRLRNVLLIWWVGVIASVFLRIHQYELQQLQTSTEFILSSRVKEFTSKICKLTKFTDLCAWNWHNFLGNSFVTPCYPLASL